MTSVLVLNATYEPLSFARLARAVALVIRGDAVIEEVVPGRVLRHASGEMPMPKLIRLLRFVKVPIQHGPAVWSKGGVLKRDRYTCGYCGRSATTVDHIKPTSRGGDRRSWLNTVAACTSCNSRKADRNPHEARMALNLTPFVPMKVQLGSGS